MFYKAIVGYLLIILFVVFPLQSFALKQTDLANKSAIESKYVVIDKHPVYYNELGRGETILLVHGLFANKEQWQAMMPILTKNHFHVVALDLPGYGKSLGFPLQSYDLKNQTVLLHDFMRKLNIPKFHIAGNSMGGAIATLYTLKYPKEIKSLTFIGSPLGVPSPIASPTDKLFQQGKDPFVPTTAKQVKQTLNLLFVHPPVMSQQELVLMAQQNVADKKQKQQIVAMLTPYKKLFAVPLNIMQPSLIIWGNNDDIFNVSGAAVLHKALPHSMLVILNDAGHLPQLDAPHKTAEIYAEFLKKHVR